MSRDKYLLALCTSAIVLLSIFGRRLQRGVTQIVDGRFIAFAIFIFLLIVLGALYTKRRRKDSSVVILCISLFLLICGGMAVYLGYLQPVETMHFLIFSWFGYLSSAVFGFAGGILVVFSMAIGDEILQYYLPDRVGDLHDVLVNTLSGLAGLLLKWRP